jgi:hypothetical protein
MSARYSTPSRSAIPGFAESRLALRGQSFAPAF